MWYRISNLNDSDNELISTCIVFKNNKDSFQVLLEKRGTPPNKGKWCIPGGHVELNENPLSAAARELFEETNLKINKKDIHFLDENVIKNQIIKTYYCLFNGNDVIKAGSDAAHVEWVNVENLPDLIYDNKELIEKALNKINK